MKERIKLSMDAVVIIGGGASGLLAAAQLLFRGAEVTLIDPAAELGQGMAYSTECPLHLLNVPATNMSALPDEREHFLQWLERIAPGEFTACSFAPRMLYGGYMRSILEAALRTGRGRFHHLRERAATARIEADGVLVETEGRQTLRAEAMILATGNAAPAAWPNLPQDVASSGRFFNMAWMEGAFKTRDHQAAVLLLGSGLTAVDALLALRHQGHSGTVYMVSRRGLLPQVHVLPISGCIQGPRWTGLDGLLRQLRIAASDTAGFHAGWREAVDSIRPDTNAYWQACSALEQRRFLRHLRPFWDTHRHRMAPQIGATVHSSLRDGTLKVLAGSTRGMRLAADGLEVDVSTRGSGKTETLHVERVINCTGPAANLARTANPLLRNLVERGILQPDRHRLGALVDGDGALMPASGALVPIYALGPLRMGTLIESVAIPEIRVQARDLAELLMRRGTMLSPVTALAE